MKTKVIAIHLPQFHVIPENEEWWGEGFTEWTNVKRGVPFYWGHYQPREPLNDNYYDLSDLSVLEKQMKLARRAGIYGFGFYHYYFGGKKLLEKPIESYRDHSKETFPYCLIWANQSWMRTWYRATTRDNVMLRQVYGDEEDWEKQFHYLLTFFQDDRYIKIGNKPLYILYIPQDINCRKRMFSYWNSLAQKNGFDGIYFVAMKTIYGEDACTELYDAYMDFEPLNSFAADTSFRKEMFQYELNHASHINRKKKSIANWWFCRNIYSYSYLCRIIEKRNRRQEKKTFAGTFPDWDNSSRRDEKGIIIRGSSPKKFGKHVEKMLRQSEELGNEFLFINAWNEWSEGAYLEPDKRYGYAYLQKLRQAVKKYQRDDR